MKKQIFVVALAAALTGCASMTGYTPTVDLGAFEYHPDQGANLVKDTSECQALASSEGYTGQAVDAGAGAVAGGAVGAVGGASVGAALAVGGGAALAVPILPAAAVGAAVIGVPALGYSMFKSDEEYKIAFRTCLRGRGYSVVK